MKGLRKFLWWKGKNNLIHVGVPIPQFLFYSVEKIARWIEKYPVKYQHSQKIFNIVSLRTNLVVFN